MKLTYKPSTGHVKCDGAVIGRITEGGGVWTWSPFTWDQNSRALSAPSLDLLFAKIRQTLIQNVARSRTPSENIRDN